MENNKKGVLSIVLPSYNEEKNVPRTAKILAEILAEAEIQYELIFVNDGSCDGTWDAIKQAAEQDPCVVGVNFSRNFGKEAAIMAGLAQESGDCCVVMDCDLQHPPKTVVEMYRLWQKGYMVVEGVKRSRGKESKLHAFCAKAFYSIMSSAVKIDMARASDFKLMDRKVVQALLRMPEHNAFFRALSSWCGFKSTSVEFDVQERVEGQSKWSTKSLVKYAVNNITSFSAAPLQLVTGCGVVMLLFSIGLTIQTLVRYFRGNALEGFTTVILLQLLTGSILMISLGMIGYYLEKMFDELKARPRYLVADVIGGRNGNEEHV
jgi:dolichol-phosphate mannosyltransferase